MSNPSNATVAAVNEKNFGDRLGGVVRSGKSIRANIHELTLFAITFYLDPKNSGNTDYLNRILTALTGLNSLNHKLWISWVEATCNVKIRGKAGEQRFGKAVRGESPALLEGVAFTEDNVWWTFAAKPSDKDVDILKLLTSAKNTINRCLGDDAKKSLKAGQECIASDIVKALEAMAAQATVNIAKHEAAQAETIREHNEQNDVNAAEVFVGPRPVERAA